MPFKGYHSCRLHDPEKFVPESFRYVKQGDVLLVTARRKGEAESTAQSIHYAMSRYTSEEAEKAGRARGAADFEAGTLEAGDAWGDYRFLVPQSQSVFDTLLAGKAVGLDETPALPTHDFENVAICGVGKWTASDGTTVTFTRADLEEMAANEKRMPHLKAIFKLAHLDPETHQRVTNLFAFGRVKNLKVVGEKLLADIVSVPRKIAQLIKAGTLGQVSAELWTKDRPYFDSMTQKRIANVVTAVGVLGSDRPAVKTVDDMMALFDEGASREVLDTVIGFGQYVTMTPEGLLLSEIATETPPETEKKQGGDVEQYTKEQVDRMIADARAQTLSEIGEAVGLDKEKAGDLKLVKEEARSFKTTADEAQRELRERDERDLTAKTDHVIAEAKRAGKLRPADEKRIRLDLAGWVENAQNAADRKVSILLADGTTKRGTPIEKLETHFATQPTNIRYGELGVQMLSDPDAMRGIGAPEDIVRRIKSGEAEWGFDPEDVKRNARIEALRMKSARPLSYGEALSLSEGTSAIDLAQALRMPVSE
jgi:hypothetical protein